MSNSKVSVHYVKSAIQSWKFFSQITEHFVPPCSKYLEAATCRVGLLH